MEQSSTRAMEEGSMEEGRMEEGRVQEGRMEEGRVEEGRGCARHGAVVNTPRGQDAVVNTPRGSWSSGQHASWSSWSTRLVSCAYGAWGLGFRV